MLFPAHPKTAWKKTRTNKIKTPQLTKGKLFRGIGVTRNIVPKNIQPSYSAKVKEVSAGSLRLQNENPFSHHFFMYFYLPFHLPGHMLQLEYSPQQALYGANGKHLHFRTWWEFCHGLLTVKTRPLIGMSDTMVHFWLSSTSS